MFNAVPRGASILIDVRDVDYDRRETVINAILEGAEEMKEKYKVTGGAELVYKHPPVVCADQVRRIGHLLLTRSGSWVQKLLSARRSWTLSGRLRSSWASSP